MTDPSHPADPSSASELSRAPTLLLRSINAVGSGALIGLIVAILALTFASIVYIGPLERFAAEGASLALLGATAMAAVGALTLSYRGTVTGPQDVTAVTLSVATATIVANWSAPHDGRLFATVAATVALTTLLTGVALLLVGRFRLGNFARYIPYPIIAGFLAASGLFLILGALATATGQTVTLAQLPEVLATAAPVRWVPVVALAIVLFALSLTARSSVMLLVVLALAIAGFYAMLGLTGVSMARARDMGLLLAPSADTTDGLALLASPMIVADADFAHVLSQFPVMATVAALAAIGVMLSASSIEHATRVEIHLNRDFSGNGLANIAAGLVGGMPGYHLLGATALAHVMGVRSHTAGLSAAVVCAVAFWFGPSIVAVLPLTILASVSFFLGLSLLHQGLVSAGRRLPLADLAVVVVILGVAATVGILEGIVTGILACLALFVIMSARQDVVLKQFTSAGRHSMVDRSEAMRHVLRAAGGRNLIYELNGPLFFGTAHRLYRTVSQALGGGPVSAIVLDFRHVHSIDSSAAHSFDKIKTRCHAGDTALVVTGLKGEFEAPLGLTHRGQPGEVEVFPDLDEGLEWVEDRLLATQLAEAPAVSEPAPATLADFEGLAFAERCAVATGTALVTHGAPSDGYYMVRSGRLSVSIPTDGGEPFRIRAVGPGALIGEVGYYIGAPRSATVVAETPCTLLHFSHDSLARMEAQDPAAALALHRLAARYLAVRLSENTDLVNRSR
ncbi:MAG: SulP family inorganic anion transporter [Acuticoccus sp.]